MAAPCHTQKSKQERSRLCLSPIVACIMQAVSIRLPPLYRTWQEQAAALLNLPKLYSQSKALPGCRWLCMGSEACTALHEADCSFLGWHSAETFSSYLLADTPQVHVLWVAHGYILSSVMNMGFNVACWHLMHGLVGRTAQTNRAITHK